MDAASEKSCERDHEIKGAFDNVRGSDGALLLENATSEEADCPSQLVSVKAICTQATQKPAEN